MRYFDRQTVTQVNNMAKKDVKDYIKKGCTMLEPKGDYKCHSISNRSKVITDENGIVFFTYYDKVCVLFEHLNKIDMSSLNYKRVVVDYGAKKPLERGSDVMAPGILKFVDKQENFKANDIVYIDLIADDSSTEHFAIGVASKSLEECKKEGSGIVIDVIYVTGCALDSLL